MLYIRKNDLDIPGYTTNLLQITENTCAWPENSDFWVIVSNFLILVGSVNRITVQFMKGSHIEIFIGRP